MMIATQLRFPQETQAAEARTGQVLPFQRRAPEAPARPSFVRLGGGWAIDYEGRGAILPDMKGMGDILRLLARPGEPIHCLDLAERGEEEFAGDAVLDARARAAYRARIATLREALDDAEARSDAARAARHQAELDALVQALAGALGLGGRTRRLGGLAERARTAVTWRIRHALGRIEAVHPALGRHLRNSLRTGTFCSYEPEWPVSWRLSAEAEV